MNVRVRYAPSPTGKQHIGGLRTALFNYFFARSSKGSFILRIEDTDRTRFDPQALEDIYDTFRWLGIKWDEGPDVGGDYGPYQQSERIKLYQKYAGELLEKNLAYRCYCSEERLANLRKSQAEQKSFQGYDRHCRNLTAAQSQALQTQGITPVIRFKIPLEGSTIIHDGLLGDVEKANRDINPDPVIVKSDGFPTYHLANIIDDHLMKITHVLRAQEWLSSGPLHILLYNAFGWTPPEFYHLPMVLGQDGQKLSKRHGSTSVSEFRAQGYLKEAIINYISLLGWAYDNSTELFAVQDLEKLFTLEKLNKSPAVFDYKKLEWFNGLYIRKLSAAELARRLIPFLVKDKLVADPPTEKESDLIKAMLPLVQERLVLLHDVSGLVRFLFQEVSVENTLDLIPKNTDKDETIKILIKAKELLKDFHVKSDEENEILFKEAAEKMQIKLGALLMPLRVAVTGTRVSPPLFASLRLLDAEKISSRIDKAIVVLKNN